MVDVRIPYGKGYLTAALPDDRRVELIAPAQVAAASDPAAEVALALVQPVGGRRLEDFAGARSVAIAINDKTRPVPHAHLLPPLLASLERMGLAPEQITFVIATGTHPVMPPEEYPQIVPEAIAARYRILCHDCEDDANLVDLGETSRGTPVRINRHYMEADLRIVVGNVEPHQFVGFSGGVKTAAIGLASKATINRNHAWMSAPGAALGTYEGNPAREDVEEIGRRLRVDFALNALLNGDKQIVETLAGDPVAVMAAAIPRVRRGFQVAVAQPFDLMIVAPGGHPKDINLYQAQKALAHATLVMREGGTVILCAACPEGTGSATYEHWIAREDMTSNEAVIARFNAEGFHIGAHKAFQIARDASHVHLRLISDMPPAFVRKLLIEPADDLQSALDAALADLPADAHIGVLPVANATIPMLG
ncbi:MAG: nickel-dependent lactate racemase [Anaerolineae bacterium]|nr:nickel-dependent lactate racemase [Anaerolineae bacterium]